MPLIMHIMCCGCQPRCSKCPCSVPTLGMHSAAAPADAPAASPAAAPAAAATQAKNCLSKDDKTTGCPLGDEQEQKILKQDMQLGKIQGESKTARVSNDALYALVKRRLRKMCPPPTQYTSAAEVHHGRR